MKHGKKVFLSHSSSDKALVRRVDSDLKRLGYDPWLDEIEINVGDSIIAKISEGIETSDYMILFLSDRAIKSSWFKIEWESKLHDEIINSKTRILPALVEDCAIPAVIKRKKYANFQSDYDHGLEELLRAMGHFNT